MPDPIQSSAEGERCGGSGGRVVPDPDNAKRHYSMWKHRWVPCPGCPDCRCPTCGSNDPEAAYWPDAPKPQADYPCPDPFHRPETPPSEEPERVQLSDVHSIIERGVQAAARGDSVEAVTNIIKSYVDDLVASTQSPSEGEKRISDERIRRLAVLLLQMGDEEACAEASNVLASLDAPVPPSEGEESLCIVCGEPSATSRCPRCQRNLEEDRMTRELGH